MSELDRSLANPDFNKINTIASKLIGLITDYNCTEAEFWLNVPPAKTQSLLKYHEQLEKLTKKTGTNQEAQNKLIDLANLIADCLSINGIRFMLPETRVNNIAVILSRTDKEQFGLFLFKESATSGQRDYTKCFSFDVKAGYFGRPVVLTTVVPNHELSSLLQSFTSLDFVEIIEVIARTIALMKKCYPRGLVLILPKIESENEIFSDLANSLRNSNVDVLAGTLNNRGKVIEFRLGLESIKQSGLSFVNAKYLEYLRHKLPKLIRSSAPEYQKSLSETYLAYGELSHELLPKIIKWQVAMEGL